jgi:hypothetical protein
MLYGTRHGPKSPVRSLPSIIVAACTRNHPKTKHSTHIRKLHRPVRNKRRFLLEKGFTGNESITDRKASDSPHLRSPANVPSAKGPRVPSDPA